MLKTCNSLEQVGNLSEVVLHGISLNDHLGGFDINLRNNELDKLEKLAKKNNCRITVKLNYFIDNTIAKLYPNLDFNFLICPYWAQFKHYNLHPPINFKNFVCSFNGSPHISRKLLLAALYKLKLYNPEYVSKNFSFTTDDISGYLYSQVGDQDALYKNFFIGPDSEEFFKNINHIGEGETFNYTTFDKQRTNHESHIYSLENILTQSFLHIVSETIAETYYPIITEKFVYSIVTRGLFITYGPPGWHNHLEKYYGFRLYNRIFDYSFDTIINPVERLICLLDQVFKFQRLSKEEWQDLYTLENETIEYNYNHFFSKDYQTQIEYGRT